MHYRTEARPPPATPRQGGGARSPGRGFTIVEMIVVLVLLAILGAIAAPKLSTRPIDEVQFHHQVKAALRYAQKSAIALRRNVCVTFSAGSVTTRASTAFGGACDTNLIGPGGENPYSVTARGTVSFAATPGAIVFDARGVADNPQSITVVGIGTAIVVEQGTGYVH